jgi:hypothetical protein
MTWRQLAIIWLYRLRTPALALVVLLPLLALFGLYISHQSSAVVGERVLPGTIVRAIVRQSDLGARVVYASVRLADGAEVLARPASNQLPLAGVTVQVIERRYATGDIRYFIE